MNFCDLSNDELWLVIRLYFFALAPILLSFYYLKQKNISTATAFTLLVSFFIAAIGWEIWITYGLWDGLSVNQRRSEALNCAVPQNLNWILKISFCLYWLFPLIQNHCNQIVFRLNSKFYF